MWYKFQNIIEISMRYKFQNLYYLMIICLYIPGSQYSSTEKKIKSAYTSFDEKKC